jgi:hypothetical protein
MNESLSGMSAIALDVRVTETTTKGVPYFGVRVKEMTCESRVRCVVSPWLEPLILTAAFESV